METLGFRRAALAALLLGGPFLSGALLRAQEDCNENGVADAEEIASGASEDCDRDGVPDECTERLGFSFPFRQRWRAGLIPDRNYPVPFIAEDLDGDGWIDLAVP